MLCTASVDKNTIKGTRSFLVNRISWAKLFFRMFAHVNHLAVSFPAHCCLCIAPRFMICCDSCQEWFHGDCVGIHETAGRKMDTKGQEYICTRCTTKKQSQLQPELHTQPEPELSFPECLTQSRSGEEGEGHEEQQAPKVRFSFGSSVISRWLTALSHNKI